MKKYLIFWWEVFKDLLLKTYPIVITLFIAVVGYLYAIGFPLELENTLLTGLLIIIGVPVVDACLSLVVTVIKAFADLIVGKDTLPI